MTVDTLPLTETSIVCLATAVALTTGGCIFTSGPGESSRDTGASETDAGAADATDTVEDDGGSEDTGGDADDPSPVTLDELPDRVAEVHCRRLFKCCTGSERQAQKGAFNFDLSSEQSCRDSYGGLIRTLLVASLRSANDQGRIDYDAERMAECLSDDDALECDTVPSNGGGSNPISCEGAIDPKVALGGSCRRDFECEKGVCIKEGSEDEGTCQLKPGEDESCEHRGCADGFYCSWDSDVCRPKRSKGEDCQHNKMCESHVCRDEECVEKLGAGQGCDSNQQCQTGVCNTGNDGSDGVCLGEPVCDEGE